MKKLIALVAALAFAPAAFAADSEVSHNAEYRMRYNNDANAKFAQGSSGAYYNHRFKLGLTYRSGEKFSAHASLIHNNMWGISAPASHPATFSTPNAQTLMLVNQAYASWMVSDDFMIKSGRMPVEFGDGTIFAENDYESTPYAFDGLNFAYDTEFAHIDFFMLRTGETAVGTSPDNEEDWYVFSFDIKSLPEFLKMANIHLIQYAKEDDPTEANKKASMNFGLTLGGDAGGLDYRLTYASQSGKTGPSASEVSTSGTMMDLEVGYAVPTFMNSRFALGYHNQTGDKGDDATKSTAYQAGYYDIHANAGLMDVVSWNGTTFGSTSTKSVTDGTNSVNLGLTDMWFVWTMMPMEGYNTAIQYHMFSAAEKGALSSGDLGSELDLEATKKYEGGLEMTARIGMLTPGELLKSGSFGTLSETYQKLYLQAKFNF